MSFSLEVHSAKKIRCKKSIKKYPTTLVTAIWSKYYILLIKLLVSQKEKDIFKYFHYFKFSRSFIFRLVSFEDGPKLRFALYLAHIGSKAFWNFFLLHLIIYHHHLRVGFGTSHMMCEKLTSFNRTKL